MMTLQPWDIVCTLQKGGCVLQPEVKIGEAVVVLALDAFYYSGGGRQDVCK